MPCNFKSERLPGPYQRRGEAVKPVRLELYCGHVTGTERYSLQTGKPVIITRAVIPIAQCLTDKGFHTALYKINIKCRYKTSKIRYNYSNPPPPTHTHTHTHTLTHTHARARMHTHTHAHSLTHAARTHIHTHTYARIHTRTHAYTHTHARIHTHTHTHTHAGAEKKCLVTRMKGGEPEGTPTPTPTPTPRGDHHQGKTAHSKWLQQHSNRRSNGIRPLHLPAICCKAEQSNR